MADLGNNALLRSQRFADWSGAGSFGLQLLNPATKHGFTDIQ